MQATDFGNREDRAERWGLDRPPIGSVLLEREVSAGPMIVGEVCREDSSKVTLAENDDMVRHSRRRPRVFVGPRGFNQPSFT